MSEETPKPKRVRGKPQEPTLDLDALAKLSPSEAAFLTRSTLAKLPAGLEGDAAQKWAADKMIELLPEAVANVAFNLRHGTDKQRDEATDRVLKANGMDKRDAPQQQGGLIILNLNMAAQKVPWLERMQPKVKDEE